MRSELTERDAKVLWHPYTQMGLDPYSIAIERGEGSLLFDTQGRSYIDAISSWWVTLHGHSHPEIVASIAQQASKLEQVIFSGFTHEPAIQLAEGLLEVLPHSIKRIFLSDNGSTAIEVALKLVIQYWQKLGERRTEIIAFKGGYHGDTFGAMAASEAGPFTEPFRPFLFNVHRIPPPIPGQEKASLDSLKEIIKKNKVAGFLYEPLLQGAGGMVMHSANALSELLQVAKNEGILLVADEVLTGFGRTGTLFASSLITPDPDIICLSKGLTGGFMPLGATGVCSEIFDSFLSNERKDMFFHGHSFTGNALACSAAVKSLEILKRPATKEKIENISKLQRNFVSEIKNTSNVSNGRSIGTVASFEVSESGRSNYLSSIREKLVPRFLSKGILLRPLGNTVYVLPPYSTTESQLTEVYSCIQKEISEL